MKRYKLLRDLPTFKAGDEFTIGDDGCLWLSHHSASNGHWKPRVMAYHKNTLARFPNILEDWFEEIEEPKERWCIDYDGEVVKDIIGEDCDASQSQLDIGNHFKTEEEAEKAVEKLKAWKRLRDKGISFKRWKCENQKLSVEFYFNKEAWATEAEPDLDLLFGGEE